MTKLCVAMMTYQAGEFIEDALYSVVDQISDVDVIHVLDGAWRGTAGGRMHSEDGTEDICEKFRKDKETDTFKFYYTYNIVPNLWASESIKRNWNLKDFLNWYGLSHTVLVIDADEIVHAKDGQARPMKPLIQPYRLGLLNAYSSNTKNFDYPTVRIIPGGVGFHYHSNKAMCMHDSDCNVVCDYDLKVGFENCYTIDEFRLENRASQANEDKKKWKTEYFAHRMRTEGGRCRWKP